MQVLPVRYKLRMIPGGIAFACLLAASACGESSSDRPGPLVFAARPNATDASGWQLFVANADGKGLRRLTRTDGDSGPVWSPDGARVAFDRCCGAKPGVWLVDAAGGFESWLADGAGPTWSPDGDEIAFSRAVNEDTYDIVVVNANGRDGRTLVRGGYGPSWSPDGERIVFQGDGGLSVIEKDGEDVRLLTRDREDGCAVWSPDGGMIAFAGGRDGEVYVVNADGSGLTRASRTGNTEGGDSWSSCPEWSPDGTQIVFSALGRNDPGDNEYVFTVDPDGTNQRRLSPAGDFVLDSSPVWSPDGGSIVFTNDEELGELWVMNADGSGRRRFVRGPYSEADQGLDWAAAAPGG